MYAGFFMYMLATDGFSLVNITTNELIQTSADRVVVPLAQLCAEIGESALSALHSGIFNLAQLSREFPEVDTSHLRGKLLEIMPNNMVVFGEDEVGHGEWFSSFAWQQQLWEENGFRVVDYHQRTGKDSHNPPLECVRHIMLLEKKKEEE